jgi:chromosome segregation ATPase
MAFEPINTQEELDNIVKDRIERAKKSVEEKYKDFDAFKEKAEKYDTDIAAKDDEISKSKKSIQDLEAKVRKYENDSAKTKIATEVGLPISMADRLRGDTEEELKKDAESLKASLKSSYGAAPLADPEPSGGDGDDENESYKKMLKGIRKRHGGTE